MGTSSLTYIYNDQEELFFIMYRQYDGDLAGHGYDLALFLESYMSRHKKLNMSKLARKLFLHFKAEHGGDDGEYIEKVSMNDPYYWCHDYAYHIYPNKVRIEGLEKDVEVNWKTDEFKTLYDTLCKKKDNVKTEKDEAKNIDQEDFGKIDLEKWENERNDNFGKVDWKNIKSLETWVKPEYGKSSHFNYDGIFEIMKIISGQSKIVCIIVLLANLILKMNELNITIKASVIMMDATNVSKIKDIRHIRHI
jgi:hypothetical protein